MTLTEVPPLPPGCPWYEVGQQYGLPNVKWCEENVCGWVVNPALTWSNLAFCAVALYLGYRAARAAPASARGALALYLPVGLALGLTSLAYHASYNYPLQVVDFAGMYVYFFVLLCFGLLRLGWLPRRRLVPTWVGLTLGFVPVLLLLGAAGVPFQGIFLASVFGLLGFEVFVWMREGKTARYGWFGASLATLGAGLAFSALDVTRTWCDPTNHVMQGHAIWHCLAALSLVFSFRFYEQFPLDAATAPAGAAVRPAPAED